MKQDKNEIFRAAHDASAITDYLIGLEREHFLATERVAVGPARTVGGVEHGKIGPSSQSNEIGDSLRAAQSMNAKALGSSAKMLTAQSESGIYRGIIIGETVCHVIQRQSAHTAVAHLKDLLDRQPQVGEHVRIYYTNSRGTVREVLERAKGTELDR